MARRSKRPGTSSLRPCSRRAGIPVPDQAWRLDLYLEYWLENIVKRNRRPATHNLYEMITRIYLIPGLGNRRLTSLSVPVVQDFLNQRLEKGDSVRKVQVMRTVLSAALTRAVREELHARNVARLAELHESKPATIHPWSASEARQFLAAAKDDSLYAAFVVLIFYGLRRGEARGLRWEDFDFDAGTIRIRQQVQRIRGQLLVAPVKTRASQRGLPLLDVARQALKVQTERRRPIALTWVAHGLTSALCSPPGPDGRSSRGTWSGPSAVSATRTRSVSSRFITFAIQSVRCLRIFTSRLVMCRSSLGIPGSARRWRSIPTWMSRLSEMR
jgi:integrase